MGGPGRTMYPDNLATSVKRVLSVSVVHSRGGFLRLQGYWNTSGQKNPSVFIFKHGISYCSLHASKKFRHKLIHTVQNSANTLILVAIYDNQYQIHLDAIDH